MTHVTHTLTATPPFDFRQSLAALSGFAPCAGEQRIDGETLTKAIRVQGEDLLVSARPAELPDALTVTLRAETAITPAVEQAALARIRDWFSLDDDLSPFLALAQGDAVARRAAAQLRGLHQVRFPSPFEAACWFLLSQRCPPAAARTMKARLVGAFGGSLRIDGETWGTFPEPADVGDRDALGVLGHAVKAARIAQVARAFAQVDERFLREGDFADVHAFLLGIEGVGPWTAAAVMLRGLGRTDDLRGSEWQLAPIVARLYQRPLDEAGFRALAARYGTHQGYWAYYLRNAGAAPRPAPMASCKPPRSRAARS